LRHLSVPSLSLAEWPDRPSPDVRSKIIQINFNPFWTVPVSIIRKDLIPTAPDNDRHPRDERNCVHPGMTQ
jgi:hypothetical protein